MKGDAEAVTGAAGMTVLPVPSLLSSLPSTNPAQGQADCAMGAAAGDVRSPKQSLLAGNIPSSPHPLLAAAAGFAFLGMK